MGELHHQALPPNDMVIACATNAAGYGVSLALNNTTGFSVAPVGVIQRHFQRTWSRRSWGRPADGQYRQWYLSLRGHLRPARRQVFRSYWDGVWLPWPDHDQHAQGLRCRLAAASARLHAGVLPDGAIDEFRMSPCVRYPNGTTFTPPSTSAFTVEGDYFNVVDKKHYQVIAPAPAAGSGPGDAKSPGLYRRGRQRRYPW